MNTVFAPPADVAGTPASTTGQLLITVIIGLGVLVVCAVVVRLSQKFRNYLPVAVGVGAMAAALIEPLPDATAHLWYYTTNQRPIYTAYGNSLPIWTWFSYFVVYGGLGLLIWWLIERGLTRRSILAACVPIAVSLGVAELLMINVAKVYTYYGDAAFVVAHFPTWIPLMNTAVVVAIGTGAARIHRSVPVGHQLLPSLFLAPAAVVLGTLLVPMALWTVLNTDNPPVALVYAATIVTIVIALAAIHTCLQLVPPAGATAGTEAPPGQNRGSTTRRHSVTRHA